MQGKPSRFDLNLNEDNTLEVVDKLTEEALDVVPVKSGCWKISVKNKKGKTCWRYFNREQVDKAKVRREVDSIPSNCSLCVD